MRDILSKVTTASMIAGAALLVAACGGETETTTDNVIANDLGTDLYGNEMDMGNDLGMGNDMDTGNGVDTALDNAAEATENASEAIENAQEAAE